MNNRVYYHSRHIPIEHLRLDQPMGKDVYENLLTHSLDEPYVDKLCDYGIDIVETRLVWHELEPEPGVYDFSRFERDVEKIKSKGLGVGVFPWFQHPPKWFTDGVRLKCPVHGDESTLISLWDTDTLLGIYDRLYGELAKRYGDIIDFVYVGIYGDYGEVTMPFGVKHYKFSPPHHCRRCMWDADVCAQKSKAAALEQDATDMGVVNWRTASMMEFTDKVCAIFRKHFPHTRAALPIGCKEEMLTNAQIKSWSAKIAAKYHITARWTGWCLHNTFDASHTSTRRVSTAAQFYGADFGLETPLYLGEETAPHALFEVLSNNAVIIHNDPGNIFRAFDVYQSMRDYTQAVPFQCDKAVFYPVEGEMLDKIDSYEAYKQECAKLRRFCDFEVADTLMLKDGYRKELIFLPNVPILAETAELVQKIGLNVIYCQDAPPVIIESGECFRYGTPIRDYSALGKWNGYYETKLENSTIRFCESDLSISYR